MAEKNDKLTKAARQVYEICVAQYKNLPREDLLRWYCNLKPQLEALEGELEAYKTLLIEDMAREGDDSYAIEGVGSASVQEGREIRILNAKKLVELGVSADVVAEATEVRHARPALVVRMVRNGNGDENGSDD